LKWTVRLRDIVRSSCQEKNLGQVFAILQGPMGVMRILREPPESAVVVLDVHRQEGVAIFHPADAAQTQFLYEAVLEGLVHALDAALRLRRIRADDVDVELGQGPPELRFTVGAARGSLVRQPKDAVFVAVEGHRLSVPTQVRHRRHEVVERRFGFHEA
jgi:hypothetical protein